MPRLNTVLYLNYKGFRQIENLEEYVNVKCIFLQVNDFREVTHSCLPDRLNNSDNDNDNNNDNNNDSSNSNSNTSNNNDYNNKKG